MILTTVTVSPDIKSAINRFHWQDCFLTLPCHLVNFSTFPDSCQIPGHFQLFERSSYVASRTVSDKVMMAQWVTSLDLPACCCDAMSDGFLTDIVKLANHLMTVSWHSDMVCDMLPVTPTRFSGISATTHTYAHIIHCPLVDCLTCKMDRRTWHTVRNY